MADEKIQMEVSTHDAAVVGVAFAGLLKRAREALVAYEAHLVPLGVPRVPELEALRQSVAEVEAVLRAAGLSP